MSKKANVIEAKGTIFKESGNGYFNVELEDPAGHQISAELRQIGRAHV